MGGRGERSKPELSILLESGTFYFALTSPSERLGWISHITVCASTCPVRCGRGKERRGYRHAIDEFIAWYWSEARKA
jgi:hypothetical protein